MKSSIISIFILMIALTLFSGCIIIDSETDAGNQITNFEECVEAGYPIMESYPRKCIVDGEVFVEKLSNKEVCVNLGGGKWLEEFNECEGISKELCEQYNGTYNACGSACRHDPDAEVCIQICVPYCKFN